jgi:hypothetical protein
VPGKKVLTETPKEIKGIEVEVSESPVKRPKKTKREVFGQEEATYHKEAGEYQRENP